MHLARDPEASRLHAELEHLGDDWVIFDDGLSRTGTFVHEGRLPVHHRLADGDVIRCGSTVLSFHAPLVSGPAGTQRATESAPVRLSDI